MKLVIKGTPKEIADLVSLLQSQRKPLILKANLDETTLHQAVLQAKNDILAEKR